MEVAGRLADMYMQSFTTARKREINPGLLPGSSQQMIPDQPSWGGLIPNEGNGNGLYGRLSEGHFAEQIERNSDCRKSFKRYSKYIKWKESAFQDVNKSNKRNKKQERTTDDEDHGYQSSESPLTGPVDEELVPDVKTDCMDHNRFASYEDVTKTTCTSRQNGNLETQLNETEGERSETVTKSPFLEKGIHDCTLCCTNGFFRITPGPFSEFEGNCSCTTHTLVDWKTRVTWTNSNLRHQIKVQEVTSKSPFRSAEAKRLTPYSLSHLLAEGSSYLEAGFGFGIPGHSSREAFEREEIRDSSMEVKDPRIAKEYEEKSHACPHPSCGRTFYRNEELTRHTRIHTGHKPFLCLVCGRGFVRRDHLAKHQRTHLPAHAKRTYSCPLPACTHSYTRSDALTRHMWTAHHIRARQPSRPRSSVVPAQEAQQFPSPISEGSSPPLLEDTSVPSSSTSTQSRLIHPEIHHSTHSTKEPPYAVTTLPHTSTSYAVTYSQTHMTPSRSLPDAKCVPTTYAETKTFGSPNTAFSRIKSSIRKRVANHITSDEHYIPTPL